MTLRTFATVGICPDDLSGMLTIKEPPCLAGMGCLCAAHAKNLGAPECDAAEDDGITIRCAVCGSPDVSYAVWHRPNGGSDGDLFGSWNAGDNTFCDDCDDCSDLVDKGAEPELFEEVREKYLARTTESE